jgi:hypothetical protein
MAGSGLISDGAFTAMAQSIFTNHRAHLSYAGEETVNGRKALRYRFDIPLSMSHRTIGALGVSETVGSAGSFWADATTWDVPRVSYAAVDLPGWLNNRSLEQSIEYTRVRIGERVVLLPATTEMRTELLSGEVYDNRAVFSNCQEYGSQSTITFGAEEPAIGK